MTSPLPRECSTAELRWRNFCESRRPRSRPQTIFQTKRPFPPGHHPAFTTLLTSPLANRGRRGGGDGSRGGSGVNVRDEPKQHPDQGQRRPSRPLESPNRGHKRTRSGTGGTRVPLGPIRVGVNIAAEDLPEGLAFVTVVFHIGPARRMPRRAIEREEPPPWH